MEQFSAAMMIDEVRRKTMNMTIEHMRVILSSVGLPIT
jgi:hypothetical protein